MSLTHRIFAQNVRDLRASPAADVERAGAALLGRLLHHCGRHVPVYRPLETRLRAAADGDREAWAAIRPLSGDDVVRLGTSLLAEELPDGELPVDAPVWATLATPADGPTGVLADIADRAQWEFLARSAGLRTSGRLAAILPAFALRRGDLQAPFGPWSLEVPAGTGHRWPERFPAEVTLDWLRDIEPSCLLAGPDTLARLLGAASPGALALAEIVLWRPAATAGVAAACRSAFGARLVEAVTSPFAGFAAGAALGGGFAPASETAFVEIVDPEGRPCPPGEAGRLLATALYAYRRPVLRHDLGLRAAWDPAFRADDGSAARRPFRVIRPGDPGEPEGLGDDPVDRV